MISLTKDKVKGRHLSSPCGDCLLRLFSKRRMEEFSRILEADGSRQCRMNWMPGTVLLMEDGCSYKH